MNSKKPMFMDQLQLVAVAHPQDTEVYPNEGLTVPPQPFKIYSTRDARPPVAAIDEHGHDVLSRIARLTASTPTISNSNRFAATRRITS